MIAYVVKTYRKGNNAPTASLGASGLEDAKVIESLHKQCSRGATYALIEVEWEGGK